MKIKKIHLGDLPGESFSVKLKQDSLFELIIKAIKKYKSLISLVKLLKKRCGSLNQYTVESCYVKLQKCIKKEFYLPLDCLKEICCILKIKLNNIEGQIEFLASKYVKEPLKINFPILINEDFVIISETIRTEGYLSKNLRRIELANSDTRLINNYIEALKYFKIKAHIFCLYTKISIPQEANKSNIRILNEKGEKIRSFSIRLKKLRNCLKKQIHINDYDVKIPDKKKYIVLYNNKIINCNIRIPKNGLMTYSSTFKKYDSNITSSVKLIINNIILGKILYYIAKIPNGKKSDKIYLPNIIKKSPKNVIKKAFETTFNCEGRIDKYQIGLKSISYNFLLDWGDILKINFGIASQINKDELKITHKENFIKLIKNFNFLKEEREKIKAMTKGIIMLHPNTANETYLNKVKEFGKAFTTKEFSEFLGKKRSSTKEILYNLYTEGLIDRKLIFENGLSKYLYFLKS